MPKVFWDGKEWMWDQDKKIRFDTYIDLWDDVMVPRTKATGFEYEPNEGIWDVGEWDDGDWDYAQIALFSNLLRKLSETVFTSFDEVKNRILDSYPHQTFDDLKDLYMKQTGTQAVASWSHLVNRLKNVHVGTERGLWDQAQWDTDDWYLKSIFWTTLTNRLEQAGE